MSSDFSENQKKSIQAFVAQARETIMKDRVDPDFLLYIITSLIDADKRSATSKITRTFLKEKLNKKRRVYTDYVVSKTLKEKPTPQIDVIEDKFPIVTKKREHETSSESESDEEFFRIRRKHRRQDS